MMFGIWPISGSTPPTDVILEVGPQPCCTRYIAHGSLLSIHSGYLRAALRTVGPTQSNLSSGSQRRITFLQNPQLSTNISDCSSMSLTGVTNAKMTVLYLPNVTAEQFAPLLNYMYTGYLELTVENIFGVLLATHLLHMPRALELCRMFLSSSSSTLSVALHSGGMESLSGDGVHLMERSYYDSKTTTLTSPLPTNAPRLVRPIASKASATVGLHFVAPPAATQISLLPTVPFRSLGSSIFSPMNNSKQHTHDGLQQSCQESPPQSPINVMQNDDEHFKTKSINDNDNTTDSITVVGESHKNDVIPDTNSDKPNATQRSGKSEIDIREGNTDNPMDKMSSIQIPPPVKRHKAMEVAVDSCGANGVIIDIASCDGPVRFRRVLNVMYGCNKSNRSPKACRSDSLELSAVTEEDKKLTSHNHSLRYVTSFHKQMARNISDVGKLTKESSLPASSPGCAHISPQPHAHHSQQATLLEHIHQKDENIHEHNTPSNNSEDLACSNDSSSYTCVYCNHSFKSHYCYQKHAKRHLIPQRLDNESDNFQIKHIQAHKSYASHSHIASTKLSMNDNRRYSSGGNKNSSTSSIKREVKPLDMNVQYYPCKTCGSKFPSYYFVHKHRKLCHADDDNDKLLVQEITSRATCSSTHPKEDKPKQKIKTDKIDDVITLESSK